MSRPEDDGFEAYRSEIEAAERKVAGEIQPGARAMVVAILVFVLLVSLILPHTGGARGVDVLMGDSKALSVGIALPSRLFTWLALVFGVGFSMLALLTRRWVLAWIALAGSALASAVGLLAVWSRQTAAARTSRPGHRAAAGLARGDPADVPLGAGGVDAHRRAAGRRGAAPRRVRRAASRGPCWTTGPSRGRARLAQTDFGRRSARSARQTSISTRAT